MHQGKNVLNAEFQRMGLIDKNCTNWMLARYIYLYEEMLHTRDLKEGLQKMPHRKQGYASAALKILKFSLCIRSTPFVN